MGPCLAGHLLCVGVFGGISGEEMGWKDDDRLSGRSLGVSHSSEEKSS